MPSHVRALVAEPLLHVAAAHVVPLAYFWQAPMPSQEPLVPQDAAVWSVHSLSGSVPDTTLPHTPSAPAPFFALLHAWQVPLHALSQHTPSTQWPLVHWAPSPPVHDWPL